MTKNEFFNVLMDELNEFPEAELYNIINYYQCYFSFNLLIGKSSEEIIDELGNPHSIAQKIIEEYNAVDNSLGFNTFISEKYAHIFTNYDYNINNNSSSNSHFNNNTINIVLRVGIIILLLVILLPILAGILHIIFISCKVCIQLIIENLNLAIGKNLTVDTYCTFIPPFILNFPKYSLILFSLAAILTSIFFILMIWYFLKLIIFTTIDLLKKLKK